MTIKGSGWTHYKAEIPRIKRVFTRNFIFIFQMFVKLFEEHVRTSESRKTVSLTIHVVASTIIQNIYIFRSIHQFTAHITQSLETKIDSLGLS